jgi:hypothetical protein
MFALFLLVLTDTRYVDINIKRVKASQLIASLFIVQSFSSEL